MTPEIPKEGPLETRLSECPKGSECLVKELLGPFRGRFSEMGLNPGTKIKIIDRAGINGPIIIQFRGYRLSIRKEEAYNIIIKIINW